jgi:hypothetical protein
MTFTYDGKIVFENLSVWHSRHDTDYLIYSETFHDGTPEFFSTLNELLSLNYSHPFRALFKQKEESLREDGRLINKGLFSSCFRAKHSLKLLVMAWQTCSLIMTF